MPFRLIGVHIDSNGTLREAFALIPIGYLSNDNQVDVRLNQIVVGQEDLFPEVVSHDLQQLIRLETAAVFGADGFERREDRAAHCNGQGAGLPDRKKMSTQISTIKYEG